MAYQQSSCSNEDAHHQRRLAVKDICDGSGTVLQTEEAVSTYQNTFNLNS